MKTVKAMIARKFSIGPGRHPVAGAPASGEPSTSGRSVWRRADAPPYEWLDRPLEFDERRASGGL